MKPKIVISKCLGFAACRYDGRMARRAKMRDLRRYIDFQPVCPEAAIGLGVPRKKIRLVQTTRGLRLVQPATPRRVPRPKAVALARGRPEPFDKLTVPQTVPSKVEARSRGTTKKDLTARMRKFSRSFLGSLGKVDGFILKSRSPSCGIGNVKIYRSTKSRRPVSKGRGFFAAEVMRKFPGLPVKDEKELTRITAFTNAIRK